MTARASKRRPAVDRIGPVRASIGSSPVRRPAATMVGMSATALIVIDVQESFRVRPNWQAVNHPDIADRIGRLVRAARHQGDLVVWVLHTEPGTGGAFDPANGHVRLIDGLEPAPGEPMITKTSHNAFTTTNLQQILTQHGVTEV